MRALLLPSLLFAVTALPHMAQAEAGEVINLQVPHGDLDLATRSGQRTLHVRIMRAISEACGTAADVRYPQLVRAVDACRATALSDAEAKVRLLTEDRAKSARNAPGETVQFTARMMTRR